MRKEFQGQEHPDYLKEVIRYTQVWLSLIFVVFCSILGWLFSNRTHMLFYEILIIDLLLLISVSTITIRLSGYLSKLSNALKKLK